MKHTDFFTQTRAIKAKEYDELYAAIEAHGGIYEWDLASDDYPIIAVNVESTCPNPTDVEIEKVFIENGMLRIRGKDKEYGENIRFEPTDVFAGHLSFIIDDIPSIGGVDDVTGRQTDFPITTVSRDDVTASGYDTSNLSDEKMAELAKRMGDAYLDDGYWDDLKIIADQLNIPSVADSWFQSLEFKEMERVTGFRQDDFSPDDGYQDFVDACEDWWHKQSKAQKQMIYNERN